MKDKDGFTHLARDGQVQMVNIADKATTKRFARAAGRVKMKTKTLKMIAAGEHAKGSVITTAKLAGIQAAKRCAELIPLCHPLPLTAIDLEVNLEPSYVAIQATCHLEGKTGAEMEALTAVSVAALTIYDMCKAVDKDMSIENIRLLEKQGGKSGYYKSQP